VAGRLEQCRLAAFCQDGVVIIWINGPFGVGKTTTAGLLAKRLDDAKIFDPEYVGYMLMRFVETPTGDFQDLPLWRRLVVETMTGLAREYPYTWIAPMSLINGAYRAEILGGIRAAGVDLLEVVLVLPEAQLRARIDADQVEINARQWRQDHVAQALATFGSLTGACFIDASQAPESIVEAALARI
jgi:predicted kinase